MKKITVFGATGRTGKHIVTQALQGGYRVVAFARTPSKLDAGEERLTVVQGDILEAGKVAGALEEVDAVISALGPTTNTPDYQVSRGMDHILSGMQAHGVRRLVVSVGAGVRDPNDQPGLVENLISWMVRTFSRHVYEDMRKVYEKVRESDRDWIIVRVPMLTDSPKTGTVRVGYVGKGVGARLSRADMANFMLEQVENDDYLHQAPVISN